MRGICRSERRPGVEPVETYRAIEPVVGALSLSKPQAPEIDDVSMDGRDGYASSRRGITQGWADAKVRNAVVLTSIGHGISTGTTVDAQPRNHHNVKFYNDNRVLDVTTTGAPVSTK
jgi:hypothetical protein